MMLQYINRFNIAAVGNRSEIVLNMIQDRPVFTVSDDAVLVNDAISEVVAEYAMTREVAAELVQKLSEILNASNN